MGPASIAAGLIHQERGNHHRGETCARRRAPSTPPEPDSYPRRLRVINGGGLAMLGILERIFFYQCACCDKSVPFGRYVDGAYYCLECSRGEHRHAGWGSKAA